MADQEASADVYRRLAAVAEHLDTELNRVESRIQDHDRIVGQLYEANQARMADVAGLRARSGPLDAASSATDSKIAAAEARTETKLAVMSGRFDALSLQLTQVSTSLAEQRAEASANRTTIITTVFGVGFALAALLVAAMAYGDSVFSRGMSVRDVVDAAVHDAQKSK